MSVKPSPYVPAGHSVGPGGEGGQYEPAPHGTAVGAVEVVGQK